MQSTSYTYQSDVVNEWEKNCLFQLGTCVSGQKVLVRNILIAVFKMKFRELPNSWTKNEPLNFTFGFLNYELFEHGMSPRFIWLYRDIKICIL